MEHIPVLLNETLESLNIHKDGIYLDLTLGKGGHASQILKKLSNKGLLVGFDKDNGAIKKTGTYLNLISQNFKLINSDFRFIKNQLDKMGINSVDGILIDLGVSSPQLDDASRGFSYSKDSKLDMRMDQNQKLNAHEVVNTYSEHQLVEIFRHFADVKLPKRVAKGIMDNRPINTTLNLVDVIRKSLPAKIVRMKNPAKAVFQAIRIEVNNEIDSLKDVLVQALDLLKLNGKLSIISFHSIEDRIVKLFFKELLKNKHESWVPIQEEKRYKVKVYKPKLEEIRINRRSRSAKLRVLTKLI